MGIKITIKIKIKIRRWQGLRRGLRPPEGKPPRRNAAFRSQQVASVDTPRQEQRSENLPPEVGSQKSEALSRSQVESGEVIIESSFRLQRSRLQRYARKIESGSGGD